MLTITPRPASVIAPAAYLAPSIVPITLIARTRSISSAGIASIGLKCTIAALLMRISSWPKRWTVAATTRSQSASERTSSFSKTALSPISAAVSRPLSSMTSHSTTLAPSAANSRAVAAPIPCAAPVIIATLPASLATQFLLFSVWDAAGQATFCSNGADKVPRVTWVPLTRFWNSSARARGL